MDTPKPDAATPDNLGRLGFDRSVRLPPSLVAGLGLRPGDVVYVAQVAKDTLQFFGSAAERAQFIAEAVPYLRWALGPDNSDRIIFCSGLARAAHMSELAVKLLEMVGAQVPADLAQAAAAERTEREAASARTGAST